MILNQMQIYSVYEREDKDEPLFVKEGFHLWAFLFTPFWALYHRIWWLLVVTIVINLLLAEFSGLWPGFVQAGWVIFVGLCAADFKGNALRRGGYRLMGISTGHSLLEAQQRYFDSDGVARFAQDETHHGDATVPNPA